MSELIITPKSIKDWRDWLKKNHLKETRVVLIKYKKHTGKPIISNSDAMKEALCFGWIDTTARRIDEDRWSITYVRRNKNSKWSKNTIRYGKELLKAGRMFPFGIKMFKEGLSKKTHDHDIPQSPDMPLILKKALGKDMKAKEFFEKLAPSRKKMYYRWILHARMEETRIKRVNNIVKMCREGKKGNPLPV